MLVNLWHDNSTIELGGVQTVKFCLKKKKKEKMDKEELSLSLSVSHSHLYSSLFIRLSLPSPFASQNPFLWTKPPDIPKSLREMPESISWVIISVQSTLSSRIICSQALWRAAVMPEISWHVINCEWLAGDKHETVCFVLAHLHRTHTERAESHMIHTSILHLLSCPFTCLCFSPLTPSLPSGKHRGA